MSKVDRVCIYCANRRGCTIFSLEHVWPQSLGGAACTRAWQTRDVCKRCNEIAGQWVDAGFQKNWFISQETALAARSFMNPAKPNAAPLIYLGFDHEIPLSKEQVCERWAGQAGEEIYHIRERDEPKWEAIAGGDFRRGHRGDRAFMRLAAGRTSYWHSTALCSFAKFKSAHKRCLTILDGLPRHLDFKHCDEEPFLEGESEQIDWIRSRPNSKPQNIKIPLDLDHSDRFLAKLALGFSHCILGPQASQAKYADSLRNILWKQPPDMPVRRTNFFPGRIVQGSPAEAWHTEGCWTIVHIAAPDGFSLCVITPAGRLLAIDIASDPFLWSGEVGYKYALGIITLVAPHRGAAVGPLPLPIFLGHRSGALRDESLQAFEALSIDPSILPPIAEIEAEFPAGEVTFEMSNLSPRETGLDFVVFVSPKMASHAARIKVTLPPWGSKPEAVYTIAPFGLVAGEAWLAKHQEDQLRLWVEANLAALLAYWNGDILYDEELRAMLVPVRGRG